MGHRPDERVQRGIEREAMPLDAETAAVVRGEHAGSLAELFLCPEFLCRNAEMVELVADMRPHVCRSFRAR